MSTVKHDTNYNRHYNALCNAMEYISSSSVAEFVDELYLYGSFARGDFTWDSDVDLFLVLFPDFKEKNPFWKEELLKLCSEISGESISNIPIDLKIVFGRAWCKSSQIYYQNVRRESKKIW